MARRKQETALRKKRSFSAEFRAEATRMVLEEGLTVAQAARDLDLTESSLRNWDRGAEMARHREFTVATEVDVYFCDPQSSWQRGTNENTNRRLRQYLPKGTDLGTYSQVELNQIARRLNRRAKDSGLSHPCGYS